MSTSPLAGKRVLVTGGAGFLGGFVVEELRARGVTDIIVPRKRDYDLVDREAVHRLLSESRPDVVFHLAAQVGGIGINRDSPGKFLFDNAMMGLQIFEESRQAKVEKLIALATICAYPKFAPVPFKEEDLWNGFPEETNAAYGVAKKLLLVQSEAYRSQYGMSSIVLFPVNLYGPRDNFDLRTSHVIPAMIRKFVDAREEGRDEVVLWGDGSPTREFLYVADAAEGIVDAGERYDSSDPVNLGTGQEITVADLAQLVATVTGYSGRFVWDTSKPNGQPRRRLDVTRARERFGFEARTPLLEGLRRTALWYEGQRTTTTQTPKQSPRKGQT